MLRNKLVRAAAAGGLVVGAMIPASSAFAVYGEPEPGSSGVDNGGAGDPADSGTLPLTGGDVIQLSLIGGALAIGGTVLARSNRRKAIAG
jgi:LPXTG-motif cell wall-anchored protein